MEQNRIRAVVQGRVQGVGFRYHTQQHAVALGVVGYVRNQADGTVEVQAQGGATAIANLVQWLHHGPPAATVTQVDVTQAEATHSNAAQSGPHPPTAPPWDSFTIQR